MIEILKSHPQWELALSVYHTLKSHGHETYLAGGCVRDACLGRTPKDLDIATSALPDQVVKLFPKTLEVGKSFGVVRVVQGSMALEVATFRIDGPYLDGRHPEKVTFSSAIEDAKRRDFTVNALFFDLEKETVIDFVEGQKDLRAQCLRAVGDATQRFQEDHLRVLRALRFAVQLGFQIEPETWRCMEIDIANILRVSPERIREEFEKILSHPRARLGIELLEKIGAFKVLFPEAPPGSREVWRKLLPIPQNEKPFAAWMVFFWSLLAENSWAQAEPVLERFRPTREEKRALKMTHSFLQHLKEWEIESLGQKIQEYADPAFQILLNKWAILRPDSANEVQKLKKEYLAVLVDGQLPEPFLKGEDVNNLAGKERGQALQQAFWRQLEGRLKTRKEALEWLKTWSPTAESK